MAKVRQGLQNMEQTLIGSVVCDMLHIFEGQKQETVQVRLARRTHHQGVIHFFEDQRTIHAEESGQREGAIYGKVNLPHLLSLLNGLDKAWGLQLAFEQMGEISLHERLHLAARVGFGMRALGLAIGAALEMTQVLERLDGDLV